MDLMYQQLKNYARQVIVVLKPSLLHVNLGGDAMALIHVHLRGAAMLWTYCYKLIGKNQRFNYKSKYIPT